VMRYYFKDIQTPAAIILGCTHFPLISKALSGYFDDLPLMIHSGEAIVEYLEKEYGIKEQSFDTQLKLFASDNVEGLRKTAKEWLSE